MQRSPPACALIRNPLSPESRVRPMRRHDKIGVFAGQLSTPAKCLLLGFDLTFRGRADTAAGDPELPFVG